MASPSLLGLTLGLGAGLDDAALVQALRGRPGTWREQAGRWSAAEVSEGPVLQAVGGFGYFGTLLVAIPEQVLSGATTVLFGLIFAGGLEVLSRGRWTQDHMIAAGLPLIAGLGLLFTAAATTAKLPNWLSLLVGQPLVVAVVLAVAFVVYFSWRGDPEMKADVTLADAGRGDATAASRPPQGAPTAR